MTKKCVCASTSCLSSEVDGECSGGGVDELASGAYVLPELACGGLPAHVARMRQTARLATHSVNAMQADDNEW